MFIKPKNGKLERVYTTPKMPLSHVAVGTYDIQKYQSMGDQVKTDDLLSKLKNYEYNAYKQYNSNRHWIEKARKNYMAQVKKSGTNETEEQFLEAMGFDDEDE